MHKNTTHTEIKSKKYIKIRLKHQTEPQFHYMTVNSGHKIRGTRSGTHGTHVRLVNLDHNILLFLLNFEFF